MLSINLPIHELIAAMNRWCKEHRSALIDEMRKILMPSRIVAPLLERRELRLEQRWLKVRL